MDYLSNNIAVNLRRIRKAKNMSLDTVAEQTGVSKSMLAQIERAEANPTIGILGRIVSGLRIEFDDLIEGPKVENYMLSVKDMIPTKEITGQYKVYTCFPITDNKIFEIYRIEIETNRRYISGSHGENTCEYITVMSGVLTMKIEDEVFYITKDDVFKFDTDKKHEYCNEQEEKVVIYSLFTAMK
jgi:XRE family transcriptional regulator, regulator of sulfur utilization